MKGMNIIMNEATIKLFRSAGADLGEAVARMLEEQLEKANISLPNSPIEPEIMETPPPAYGCGCGDPNHHIKTGPLPLHPEELKHAVWNMMGPPPAATQTGPIMVRVYKDGKPLMVTVDEYNAMQMNQQQ